MIYPATLLFIPSGSVCQHWGLYGWEVDCGDRDLKRLLTDHSFRIERPPVMTQDCFITSSLGIFPKEKRQRKEKVECREMFTAVLYISWQKLENNQHVQNRRLVNKTKLPLTNIQIAEPCQPKRVPGSMGPRWFLQPLTLSVASRSLPASMKSWTRMGKLYLTARCIGEAPCWGGRHADQLTCPPQDCPAAGGCCRMGVRRGMDSASEFGGGLRYL